MSSFYKDVCDQREIYLKALRRIEAYTSDPSILDIITSAKKESKAIENRYSEKGR